MFRILIAVAIQTDSRMRLPHGARQGQTMELTDGLVPRYARTRGGGSSGVVVTELNATR